RREVPGAVGGRGGPAGCGLRARASGVVRGELPPAGAPAAVPATAAARRGPRRVPGSGQPRRAVSGPGRLRSGSGDRARHRHRDRRDRRGGDGAEPVVGALPLPVRGGTADHPDPGDGAALRPLVRVRAHRPGAGVRAGRAVPDRRQHPVRAAVGRAGTPRPVHFARCRPADPPVEAAATLRPAVDRDRPAHLRRPERDRRDRRRLLLPPRRARHRHPHRPLPSPVRTRTHARRRPACLRFRRGRVHAVRPGRQAGHRLARRHRRPAGCASRARCCPGAIRRESRPGRGDPFRERAVPTLRSCMDTSAAPGALRAGRSYSARVAAGLVTVGVALVGGADDPVITPGQGGGDGLAAVCPDPVVVQSPWWPQSEHGVFYHLVGEGYTIDPDQLSVTGPLVAGGVDTGVQIEIRAGGPAVGFQNAGTVMYTDEEILLGQVATDDAIGLSAEHPVVAVMAPMEVAPYMIMWDPERFPEFQTVVDIGRTDTTVLYFEGATYMDYLVGAGILRAEQIDGGYDGSPSRWLAEDGDLAQQGFATSEPFVYEQELDAWGKPVRFQLIHHTGYPIYAEAIVVRADLLEQHSACLEQL